jgi:CubicO group peptidase (beta-lactamase class C family)
MSDYFPAANDWKHLAPSDAGFNELQLQDALAFATTCEIDASTDLTQMMPKGERHPNDRPLGPVKERSKAAGLVVRDGYIVGAYGPVDDVQLTFSATKSYISAVAGLAYDSNLFTSLDERVGQRVRDGGFDSAQNAPITWRHLLQQTCEWEGELFGLPDWIDRGRVVGGAATMGSAATIGVSTDDGDDYRSLETPGTFWEYNDVRVNRTALSLLRLFGQPLPSVLKRHIMDPIGASNTWQWHGYETSWVETNGQQIQSVSGGAHWGGGLWINTHDHARFGLLYLREGRWQDRQLLSKEWIAATKEPCVIKSDYGLLWWLNDQGSIASSASARSFAAQGAGGNLVFVEPAHDLVIVLRWCADPSAVLNSIIDSLV